jgi:hypothetical protein
LTAVAVHVDFCGGIDRADLPQRLHEHLPEFRQGFIARPELILDRRPRDELPVRFLDPVQPLRQPRIEIEPQGRFPDTVRAALETVGTTIVFRPGATDAERLEALFESDITPGMLASLDNGHFAARVLQYGRPSMPLKGYLPPLSYLSAGRGPAIIRNSRERFAFPRHKVEGWIEQFLASASPRNIVKEHKRELDRIKRENTTLKSANRRKDDVIGVLVGVTGRFVQNCTLSGSGQERRRNIA